MSTPAHLEPFFRDRGFPWQHDPGPPSGTEWLRLFAATPNYRRIGLDHGGSELFRWHHGPMFYRGRLEPGTARVLVIGQEGAQDESLAHRAFVGGTGARMQHFLRHIGISKSYLFLNTFVYPIFGQYDETLRPLAQHARSPIVQHRHALLEHAAEVHDLHLIVAVGVAARESVQTWRRMRGQPFGAKTRVIEVAHPGATAAGGAAAVLASFRAAVAKVTKWTSEDPSWLPPDDEVERDLEAPYRYRSAPIPFVDLPLGSSWRLGSAGTSSNRRDGQRAIQLFSKAGSYNNTGAVVSYSRPAAATRDGYRQDTGDVPYEPPRSLPGSFDEGPDAGWSRLLMGGERGFEWPDFGALGLTAHASLGTGPIYRGRPGEAVVAVLADQTSQDDLFCARALCGEWGQRLQRWLGAAGFTRSYCILRILPVDSLNNSDAVVGTALAHPAVVALYRRAFDLMTKSRVFITLGQRAETQATKVNARSLPMLHLGAAENRGWLPRWQTTFAELASLGLPTDTAPESAFGGGREVIARHDLPYGTLRWKGSSGDLAQQARIGGKWSPDYFKLTMPGWVNDLPLEE